MIIFWNSDKSILVITIFQDMYLIARFSIYLVDVVVL